MLRLRNLADRVLSRVARVARPLLRGLMHSHPWLAAVAPILLLGAANVDQITAASLEVALAISLAGTTAIFVLLWLACRDVRKAALITTVAVALFFSYGHMYGVLAEGVHYASRTWLNIAATTASLGLWFLLA